MCLHGHRRQLKVIPLLLRTRVNALTATQAHQRHVNQQRAVMYLRVYPTAEKRMHALKSQACRKRVAAASSPAATCKQDAALTSPARHACGCARPSRARLGHENS